MRFLPFLGLALVALYFLSCSTSGEATGASGDYDPANPLVARVTGGRVVGFRESGVRKFLGIPFAAPPVGDLRWRAPQPVRPWGDSLRPAKDFGATPMQHNLFGDMYYRSAGFAEDCLYLNVWAPDSLDAAAGPLPVLVYFYGGGFVAGDGSETRYDGAALAREGIIVVTTNYRLNIFGFFAHPELRAESPHKATGNYGLLDQVAALEWVRDNIRAFGGDPRKVTIGGESAGSWSVSAHFGSPLSQNLFRGAIGQSGAAISLDGETLSAAAADSMGLALAKALATPGAVAGNNAKQPTLAELRTIPADTLYARYLRSKLPLPRLPIDGHFMKRTLAESYAAGAVAKVPLVVGWTSAEGGDGAWVNAGPESPAEKLEAALRQHYGSRADAALAAYPHATPEEIRASAADFNADNFIVGGTWAWARLHAERTGQPVYRFVFAEPVPGKSGGAPHASDIPYAMGNLSVHADHPYGDAHRATEQAMTSYFANFIKTGNPNGAARDGAPLPQWPATAQGPREPVAVFRDGVDVTNVDDARWLALRELWGI